MYEGSIQVDAIRNVADSTKCFYFSIKECVTLPQKEKAKPEMPFLAGQFISIGFSQKEWRAYSIASPPNEKKIELIIRLIPNGFGSEILKKTKKGDVFPFRGPFGSFTLKDTPDTELVFCATGTGIAPLRSMILTESQKKNPRPITLFYGGRNREDIAYLDEIKSWAKNITIKIGLSQEKDPKKLGKDAENVRITDFVEKMDITEKKQEFYICGNTNMIESVVKILKEKKYPENKIHMERFN